MHAGRAIGLAVAVLLVAAMPPAARADTPWSIGAAKVDTTPPAFDAAQDLQDFPEVDTARGITCPRDVYNGPRLWRFEEPFQDTDGSGDFNYPGGTAEPFCDYNHNGRREGIYPSGEIEPQRELARHGRDLRRATGPERKLPAELGDRRVLHGLAGGSDRERRSGRLRQPPAGLPAGGRVPGARRPEAGDSRPVPDDCRRPQQADGDRRQGSRAPGT